MYSFPHFTFYTFVLFCISPLRSSLGEIGDFQSLPKNARLSRETNELIRKFSFFKTFYLPIVLSVFPILKTCQSQRLHWRTNNENLTQQDVPVIKVMKMCQFLSFWQKTNRSYNQIFVTQIQLFQGLKFPPKHLQTVKEGLSLKINFKSRNCTQDVLFIKGTRKKINYIKNLELQ